MENFTSELHSLNWGDIEQISVVTQNVLKRMASDKSLLQSLLSKVLDDPSLVSQCEQYDFLGKVALYGNDKTKFRIRFHLFLPRYANRIHYHRWCYSTIILHGGYKHFLYGTEDQFNETTKPDDVVPTMIRDEIKGSVYTINHNMVHSVIAKPGTLTLIIRGPSVKDRFLVMDKRTNTKWWQYGAKNETVEEHLTKEITPDALKTMISKIHTILDGM